MIKSKRKPTHLPELAEIVYESIPVLFIEQQRASGVPIGALMPREFVVLLEE